MGISAILIDSREPPFVQALTFGCQSVAVALLDVADLWLTCSDGALLLVERKTASDLLSSLRDGRLYPQLTAMLQQSPWCYLAVCSSIYPGPDGKCIVDGRESGWTWASVDGALLTCQEIGVHVLHVPSDFEYEQAIIRLGNRDRQALRVHPVRDVALLSDAEAILTTLPGVGEKLAAAVLERAGSVATALWLLSRWAESPLAPEFQVPGLGSGTRRKVRRALGLQDGFELFTCDLRRQPEATDQTDQEDAA